MCLLNVFVVSTLWLTVAPGSGTLDVQLSEERSNIVPIVLNGTYGKVYNEEVNNTVEYIFEFLNSQVGDNIKIILLSTHVLYNLSNSYIIY
jgi:fibrillarin-like rRNA methylase